MKTLHQVAEAIFRAGLNRVDSRSMLHQALKLNGTQLVVEIDDKRLEFNLGRYQHVYVFGVGKAAAKMALGLSDVLGNRISKALIITKDGHGEKLPHNFKLLESSHPVPDERSVLAAEDLYSFCSQATEEDLVIGLISGGASALAALPIDGITLADKQNETKELLANGSSIQEINSIRKKLSKIKGGKLARIIEPATSLNLILSDVLGDDLHTIASGLTVPEYAPIRANLHNVIIGSNKQALKAAEEEAKAQGFLPIILSELLTGEAQEAAKLFLTAAETKQSKVCFLSGGETTVTLHHTSGKGGRNQEMALAFLNSFPKEENALFLAASTDGTDGPTDAAGAFASKEVLLEAQNKELNPADFLKLHDSYHFFEKTHGLLKTGPTGTNVCDLQILLVNG